MSSNTDPYFVAPRYCEHGKLCDDYCRLCEALEALPECCPECGGDLHSAELHGKAASACSDCDWIATHEALLEDDEWDGDENYE